MIYFNPYPLNNALENLFDAPLTSSKESFYPPHNTYNIGENTYIEIAVTGFEKDEIKAYFNDEGLFVIEGKRDNAQNDDKEYFVRNLSTKNFTRKFEVPKNTELKNIKVKNGLLTAEFERITPEIKYLDIT
jgi:HSP20 family molecular chaperone IbpA